MTTCVIYLFTYTLYLLDISHHVLICSCVYTHRLSPWIQEYIPPTALVIKEVLVVSVRQMTLRSHYLVRIWTRSTCVPFVCQCSRMLYRQCVVIASAVSAYTKCAGKCIEPMSFTQHIYHSVHIQASLSWKPINI